MTPSIHLPGSWEVGLVNILFPDQINAITKNDPLYKIHFKIIYFNSGKRIGGESVTYLPTVNISGDHVYRVIPALESDVRSYLVAQKLLINDSDVLFHYDDARQNVYFNKNLEVENISSIIHDEVRIVWKFGRLAASVLGLQESKEYDFGIDELIDKYRIHPSLKSSVNHIYIYTDIVTPSRVADHHSEILGVIPLRHSNFYKTNNSTVYKSIRKTLIENISVLIKDERGRQVPFHDGGNTTCVLHIKRRD